MTDREIISALRSKLRKELDKYRQELSIGGYEHIYSHSYKTVILLEIYQYVHDCDFLSVDQERLYSKLMEEPNALEYLYDEYLSTDVANICFEIERLFTYLGEKTALEKE